MAGKKKGTSQHAIESLARCLLPEVQKYFESETGRREFAEWKQKQQPNGKKEK